MAQTESNEAGPSSERAAHLAPPPIVEAIRDAIANGDGPLYQRIARAIEVRIADGRLVAGSQLPAIRSLASDVGVNRDTVALAYDELAGEGRVERGVGRGTFVRELPAAAVGPVRALPLARPVEELLRLESARARFAAGPDLVALHALIPDPALYPLDGFRRALNKVLSTGGPELLSYGGAQGDPHLREVLARRLRRAGLSHGADEIVVCHGATQGMSLALRLFTQAGDRVAVEDPTYSNVLSTLVALGLEPEAVPLGGEGGAAGPDLEALDRVLARPEVKVFYTIPTFHNPLGTSTPLGHRRALLEVAARHGKPVIEDAFEMDLRFEGAELPSLAALDDQGLVVQLTSFSKSLFPGLRIGSLCARGRTVDALVALKAATDFSDSMPLQAALADFIESGAYDRHLVKLRRVLRERRDALLGALEAFMPDGTTWTRPQGGYQLWVELPFEVDTRDLLADAARGGVVFAPGSEFLPQRRDRASRGMRLSVAQAGPEAIRKGIEALAGVVRAHQTTDPAARQAAGVRV